MTTSKTNPNDRHTIAPEHATDSGRIQSVVRAIYAPMLQKQHEKDVRFRAAKYAHERSPWPGEGTLYRK